MKFLVKVWREGSIEIQWMGVIDFFVTYSTNRLKIFSLILMFPNLR